MGIQTAEAYWHEPCQEVSVSVNPQTLLEFLFCHSTVGGTLWKATLAFEVVQPGIPQTEWDMSPKEMRVMVASNEAASSECPHSCLRACAAHLVRGGSDRPNAAYALPPLMAELPIGKAACSSVVPLLPNTADCPPLLSGSRASSGWGSVKSIVLGSSSAFFLPSSSWDGLWQEWDTLPATVLALTCHRFGKKLGRHRQLPLFSRLCPWWRGKRLDAIRPLDWPICEW
jgi:hypothetical protein